MSLPQPIRKQLSVAAYSSTAISVLTVTPIFILRNIAFELYPWAFGMGTLLIFFFWMVDIGIYMLIDAKTGRRVWLRWLFSYAFCIGFTIFLFHDLLFRFHWHFGDVRSGIHFHVILFFAVDTVILLLQELIVTREKRAAAELENSRLRMRDMEAMHLRLTRQVQPHFLFNSLNTLKALIAVAPEQATEYLVRLSGFLRSSMTEEVSSTVKVGRELELCADYLEMQRIRFGDAIRFSIDVPAEVRASFFVPVFSVQLLVENAIKHNVLTQDRPLSIDVVFRRGVITVSNNLQRRETRVEEGIGTGLVNLRERYKALSGDVVVIEETSDLFAVTIKVLTHENSDH